MNLLLTYLRKKNILRLFATLFCNADGFFKKYRCIVAMYLLSILAQKYSICSERIIGASGYGKGHVDGLNALDK